METGGGLMPAAFFHPRLVPQRDAGRDPGDVRFVVAAAMETPESRILEIMYELSRAGVRNVVFDALESGLQE